MEQAFSVYRKIERSPKVAVHGQVHTKPHIVELMLDLVGYTGDPETKVLDPGCGDGAFTVASVRRLIASQGPPREHDAWSHCFLAIDQDEVAVENCRASVVKVLTEHGTSKKLASQLGQSWVIHGDFLERSFDQRFDLVIGNPPYVRQEAIAKDKLDFYRARYRCFYDRADLYVAFFERGLNLLQPDGQLAYICPDRFVKNQYGK